ncbi:hypothetical protein K469DRAFT_739172 [Zopfia rhizophila CBS 207.26]|uniref:ABC transporter domain-containing protein n=1 Tax=Zopfia rhizophila CBS 207.26 TaxID=1314779 RepID=A0A6A6E016_9PEZI|nr:hypothetical protein K469DRAFT_739172 [Zopfia rhizophila CBS 207.26]
MEATWGEPDTGHPSQRVTMEDFEALRKTLTSLSKTRSQTQSEQPDGLFRTISRKSTCRTVPGRISLARSETTDEGPGDIGAAVAKKEEDFKLSQFIRIGHFEKRKDGQSAKKVGVIWKNLSVKGIGSTASFVRTLSDAIIGTFGPDLYKIVSHFIPALKLKQYIQTRTLINDFSGVVRDGGMMLVLGRPGSGCSTFLKAIANNRESFAEVIGDISYGGIPAGKQKKRFRGEVNYQPEDDTHFASLNTKEHEKDEIPIILEALLKIFGISHTKYTPVGDEFVRGVSGGERKRVNNSTRGLDASTALDYAKSLRIMTYISNRTTFVTLYQAGEGIYELMDKVLVIDQGRCIFQGPANEAKQYFIDLGFRCPERQTTADFLTAVTDATERQFREGYEASAPKTLEELEATFKKSENYRRVVRDIQYYKTVHESKSKTVPKKSSFTIGSFRQVLACTRKELWLTWGDKTTLITKFFIIISSGLIVGSLFFGESLDTSGAFSRGGALFFSIHFLGWLQLSELMKAVSCRAVVKRHDDYAFYQPSPVTIARVVQYFPLLLAQVLPFCIIMYFMAGLDVDVSKFWISLLFVYTTTICMTSLYRMFASLSPTIDDAVRFSGIGLNFLIIFTGYLIPKPQLLNDYTWFGWIYYINPISYAFEAVLTNKFFNRTMACSPPQRVPQGQEIDPAYQGCGLTGADVNSDSVPGSAYLQTAFNYTRHHSWRNFGRTKKDLKQAPADEEKVVAGENPNDSDSSGHVKYTVAYQGDERKLLNNVSGYAKPGVMVALVGASGAGKTTLLNTVSQRQRIGVVSGEMLVDGKPLGRDFQRGTGYCEQMDLHDGTATIRGALEFSAILRQDRSIPRKEKLEYVDKIIDLLELKDIQDALVSSLGVEQKKRLTIGVELAAKPSLLLFLDEPTNGLDSNSAYSIVRFLKKLAIAGQAVICTIHQPSSILIQQFDMILALNSGGNTFYFRPVGDNGQGVTKYFADRGVQCPPNKNVVEFAPETAAKPAKRESGNRINWNEEWKKSESNKRLLEEIEHIKSSTSKAHTHSTHEEYEFAAPIWLQTTELTKRLFTQYWRDPSSLRKVVRCRHSWDMQDRMFCTFLIILIPPTIVNAVVPKFYTNMALWQARELPSRIYGWIPFVTAQVVAEIPIAIVSSVLYWLLWYYPTGLPTDSSTAGYVFLMTILFFLFISFTVISNVLPFFFVMFSLFNGVVRTYSQLSVFWKYWMYYVNPSTYWIGGVLAATPHNIPVQCFVSETARFNVPAGQTCAEYAGSFLSQAPGYLLNLDATNDCHNWALVYFFIWSVRIKGSSFGFGKAVGIVGGIGRRLKGKEKKVEKSG